MTYHILYKKDRHAGYYYDKMCTMTDILYIYQLHIYKKSRHAANMKAGGVVQASVMMGCYDLQCHMF